MSTEGGPKIIRADLDTVLDASSQRQSLDAKDTNILDYSTWTVGETSATGFGRNGGADENIIITENNIFSLNLIFFNEIIIPIGKNTIKYGMLILKICENSFFNAFKIILLDVLSSGDSYVE